MSSLEATDAGEPIEFDPDEFLKSPTETPDELAASWAVLNLDLIIRQRGFRPHEIGPEHDAARARLLNELMGRYGAIAYNRAMPVPSYPRKR